MRTADVAAMAATMLLCAGLAYAKNESRVIEEFQIDGACRAKSGELLYCEPYHERGAKYPVSTAALKGDRNRPHGVVNQFGDACPVTIDQFQVMLSDAGMSAIDHWGRSQAAAFAAEWKENSPSWPLPAVPDELFTYRHYAVDWIKVVLSHEGCVIDSMEVPSDLWIQIEANAKKRLIDL